VSNQRGVGKGLMTEDDLTSIHSYMMSEIIAGGGTVDAIYYCTSVDTTDPDRKPNPGMAFSAKKDFPEIDFSRSVITGNRYSDMLFGKNAGMYSVFIATTHPETAFPHPDIDARFDSLVDFSNACRQIK
jgi:HAD superfamily hydrolase (TIGR01662 family)